MPAQQSRFRGKFQSHRDPEQPDGTRSDARGGCRRPLYVVTPTNTTLSTEELDHSFDLPYERAPHPRYAGKGDIPAWEMIKHSVNIHRGCFGGCSFCTISAHQGKFINSRSERSILSEVEKITKMPGFKGYLSDVGAPSANMYRMGGPRPRVVPQMPPRVVPPPEAVPQPRRRPPAVTGSV